jgi:hypothetical protein
MPRPLGLLPINLGSPHYRKLRANYGVKAPLKVFRNRRFLR